MNPMFPIAGIAALVGIAGSFGTGFLMGKSWEEGRSAQKLLDYAKGADEVLNLRTAERDLCFGQVDEFNASVDAQKDQIIALRRAQDAARIAAQEDAAQRELAVSRANDALIDALEALKGKIDATDFGACAGEFVPPDYTSLLNDALRAARAGGAPPTEPAVPSARGGD